MSLQHLDSNCNDVFSNIFMKKIPYFTKYDQYIMYVQHTKLIIVVRSFNGRVYPDQSY